MTPNSKLCSGGRIYKKSPDNMESFIRSSIQDIIGICCGLQYYDNRMRWCGSDIDSYIRQWKLRFAATSCGVHVVKDSHFTAPLQICGY